MRSAIAFILVLLSPALAIDPPPPPYFDNAAQDKDGVVWAFSRAEYNHIYRYDGKEWSVVDGGFASDQSAMPAHVVRMTDGSVACVWRVVRKDRTACVAVTAQSGNAARLLGICPGEIDGSGLKVKPFADSRNQLWITNQSPEIFRAGLDGVVKIYEMAADDYAGGKKQRAGFNDVHAVEDGHGRIWVWSDPRASNYASLRGVLIFTGDQHVLHESIGTIKGNQILAIAKADGQHMWVAVGNDGLYRVDIDSFAAEREPDPAPKALCCVHELHVNGDELYAVESLPNFKNTLWRKKNGQWRQLMPCFDAHTSSFVPRSWLPVKEGMLVEAFQAGPWFISPEGEATQFSWKTGFPMENVRALTRFKDGSFFCLGSNSQIYCGPLALPPKEINKAPRVVQLETNRKWALDPSNKLWILSTDKPPILKQWDGHQWISHVIPGSTDRSNFERVKADDQGRIWPMPQSDSQPQAVYDSRTGEWMSFSSLPESFLAFRNNPPLFLDDDWFLSPRYSEDHTRIAYRRGVVFVCYYDGSTWQEWKRSDITGKKESDNAVGPPWFDAKGNLRVNIRTKTSWIRSADGKWAELPYEPHFSTDIWSEGETRPAQPVPPEGAVTDRAESIAVDNLGVTWIQWKNRLFKCVPGICVPVFGENEFTPFSVRRQLRDVFIDASGNAFLETASGSMGWFMITPQSPPPRPGIKVESTGPDSVQISLDANSPAKVQFRWQLDQGPEQTTKEPVLNLTSLPNGMHQFKVTVVDDQLQMATAGPVKFKTFIDVNLQLARLIGQLSSPDYELRKAAVLALARQPATAGPALEKSRIKADESTQWWIAAALQEIENQQRKTGAGNQ